MLFVEHDSRTHMWKKCACVVGARVCVCLSRLCACVRVRACASAYLRVTVN